MLQPSIPAITNGATLHAPLGKPRSSLSSITVLFCFGCRFATSVLQRAADLPAPRVIRPSFNLQSTLLTNLEVRHQGMHPSLATFRKRRCRPASSSRGEPLQTEGRPHAQGFSAPCGPQPRSLMARCQAAGSVSGIAALGNCCKDGVVKTY